MLTHLSIAKKLIVLIVMLVAPTILLVKLLIDESYDSISFINKEKKGILYVEKAWPMMSLAALGQNASAEEWAKAVTNLKQADSSFGYELNTQEQLKEVYSAMLQPSVASRAKATHALIDQVNATSNLILDPEANTYFLASATTTVLPQIMDLVALTREITLKIKLKDPDSSALRRKQGEAVGALQTRLSDLNSNYSMAFAADPTGELRSQLAKPLTSLIQTLEDYVKIINNDTFEANTIDKKATALSLLADQLFLKSMEATSHGLDERHHRLESVLHKRLMLVAIAVLASLAIATAIGRSLNIAIRKLVDRMRAIKDGSLEIDIPYTQVKTEIGNIACALMVFREAMRQQALDRALEQQVAKMQQENAALHAANNQAILGLADELDTRVGQITQSLSIAATQLMTGARNMHAVTESTRRDVGVAAKASEKTLDYMTVIAPSTEQLTASIQEISHQVARSAVTSDSAIQRASLADAQIQNLSGVAQHISEFVGVIESIADQTQLLALNATIEAARAGDAGRGFAVVASEVKALAVQTAQFTGQIESQVSNMQSATQAAVDAIREINKIVADTSHFSANMASAIEEQTVATIEISRNVQTSAEETRQASKAVANVDQAAQVATAAAADVLTASEHVGGQVRALKSDFDSFLAELRSRALAA